jgi:hypothetical protein
MTLEQTVDVVSLRAVERERQLLAGKSHRAAQAEGQLNIALLTFTTLDDLTTGLVSGQVLGTPH